MAQRPDTRDGKGRATCGRRPAQGEEAPTRTGERRHRLAAVALVMAAAVALGAIAIIVFAPRAKGNAATPITVTAASDDSDGNVSSVAALAANPGPDGTISLREAIEAINATPGQHEISFARPMTIRVGGGGAGPLPLLSGQADVVGDVNGDGTPDVTLKMAGSAKQVGTGFTLSSSDSSLRDISIEGFPIGVMFWLQPGRVYSGLAVTGIVVTGAEMGIGGNLQGHSRLTDTSINGNTISASYSGIGVHASLADQIDAIQIASNRVQLSGRFESCRWSGQGINVSSGFATSRNTIDGVTIAHNSVAGDAALGITVTSGVQGGSSNVVRNVRILQNRVRLGRRA